MTQNLQPEQKIKPGDPGYDPTRDPNSPDYNPAKSVGDHPDKGAQERTQKQSQK